MGRKGKRRGRVEKREESKARYIEREGSEREEVGSGMWKKIDKKALILSFTCSPRLMDHDTYSSHNAIGKVYIPLDFLTDATGMQNSGTLDGWFPIYDTLHGEEGVCYVGWLVCSFSFSLLPPILSSLLSFLTFFTPSLISPSPFSTSSPSPMLSSSAGLYSHHLFNVSSVSLNPLSPPSFLSPSFPYPSPPQA
jgi:hypothetical protein